MRITNMVIADVFPGDYPDFVDAFCEYAEWEDTGEPLTYNRENLLNPYFLVQSHDH